MTTQNQRRLARDVKPRRIVLGLIVAPIAPALLALPLAGYPWPDFLSGGAWFVWITATLLALPWSWAFGGWYLLRKWRSSGMIERFDCLAIGGGLAFGLPTIHMLLWLGGEWFISGQADWLGPFMILLAPVAGIFVVPFGLFGGWIFWRIAIRPTRPPVQDLAEAF